mgnify:CR=1 FL=1
MPAVEQQPLQLLAGQLKAIGMLGEQTRVAGAEHRVAAPLAQATGATARHGKPHRGPDLGLDAHRHRLPVQAARQAQTGREHGRQRPLPGRDPQGQQCLSRAARLQHVHRRRCAGGRRAA